MSSYSEKDLYSSINGISDAGNLKSQGLGFANEARRQAMQGVFQRENDWEKRLREGIEWLTLWGTPVDGSDIYARPEAEVG